MNDPGGGLLTTVTKSEAREEELGEVRVELGGEAQLREEVEAMDPAAIQPGMDGLPGAAPRFHEPHLVLFEDIVLADRDKQGREVRRRLMVGAGVRGGGVAARALG